MNRLAILQCPDTGPLESLVVMLRATGYECRIPDTSLKNELRQIGHDYVLDISRLVSSMGYDWPFRLPEADVADMGRSDVLYVDIKAHQHHGKIIKRWPNLDKRVLWYRINGGQPEHVIDQRGDHGDEVNPPCPVLTPNQWYQDRADAYCCWPPFYRFDEYHDQNPRLIPSARFPWTAPVCLIHNLAGWGYGAVVDNFRRLGILCYGDGSPDGLIPHRMVRDRLHSALCMVHLKSSDAPGYALYEALAAACPVVCTRRLIWRCKMHELLIPGETCLVFDRETHEGLTPEDVRDCTREVGEHLARLGDPTENRRIGLAGHARLKEVMWSEGRAQDVGSLRAFLQRHFNS